MPLQSRPESNDASNGLCLLSIDAGGAYSLSQLDILGRLFDKVKSKPGCKQMDRPCNMFDLIGGVGTGGFIAMLFVLLGLTVEETRVIFTRLSKEVFEVTSISAKERTTLLERRIEVILRDAEVNPHMRLLDKNQRSQGCRLIVPVAHKNHAQSTCALRNFQAPTSLTENLTIANAMLVTLATPPLFCATQIFKDQGIFDYVGGDLAISNPITEVINEAHGAFGADSRVACLLSVGSGHPGFMTVPEGSDLVAWRNLLERMAKDAERKAEDIDIRMGHIGFYHRLSVPRGLERVGPNSRADTTWIISQTLVYLEDGEIDAKFDDCVELLKRREGKSSLEQLKFTGGATFLPTSPTPLTTDFVMRRAPWEHIVNAVFPVEGLQKSTGLVIPITGMGGCGKTQLVTKFLKRYKDSFTWSFWIDGSSEARIQADLTQNIRSLGIEYSQTAWEDGLAILARRNPGSRQNLLVFDNVDDPKIDIKRYIPEGDGCIVLITSRNYSLGELSYGTHLELDVMSMDESVKLILLGTADAAVSSKQACEEAGKIAETLGCLPLALAQARSYMWRTKKSRTAYHRILVSKLDKLLAHSVPHQLGMRFKSTSAAFSASFDILSDRARKALQLLVQFHWDKVPLALVEVAANAGFSGHRFEYTKPGEDHWTLQELLKEIFYLGGEWDEIFVDEIMMELQNLSLIALTTGVDTTLIQMHPLTHDWVLSQIPASDCKTYRAAAMLLLALGSQKEHHAAKQYLLGHVSHMKPLWNATPLNNQGALACILHDGGHIEDAISLRENIKLSLEALLEPKDASVTQIYVELADSYGIGGRVEEAEKLQVEVLRLRRELLGEKHPQTLAASSDLAATYYSMGQLEEAKELEVEVLKVRRELLGEKNPDTLAASHYLAITYRQMGLLEEAERLQIEVLRLRQELLGEKHPDTITTSSSLAATYYDMGRLGDAEKLQIDVLRLRRELLGDKNPDTLRASGNLADTYSHLGRFEEAEKLEVEVLRMRRELLGEKNPDTILGLLNLADTRRRVGKHSSAFQLVNRAEDLIRQTSGPKHRWYGWLQEIKSSLAQERPR